eukprot:43012-Eustigmatos_ZCMA.PRE.1
MLAVSAVSNPTARGGRLLQAPGEYSILAFVYTADISCSVMMLHSLHRAHELGQGVKRTASQSDIKRAWRRLSLELHPDKNPR